MENQNKIHKPRTQLLEFIDDVTLNMENGKQTDILIMDFSKASDKVSHSLLLHKLHYYGIQGELHSGIQNFLSNRKQAVVLEGEKSDYVAVQPIESGVPHTKRMLFLISHSNS